MTTRAPSPASFRIGTSQKTTPVATPDAEHRRAADLRRLDACFLPRGRSCRHQHRRRDPEPGANHRSPAAVRAAPPRRRTGGLRRGRLPSPAVQQVEELHAGAGILPKRAEHRTRGRGRVLLLDPSHDHAEMGRLEHDAYAQRVELLLNDRGNLVREPLLHLQPAAEHVDDARDLAEPHHLAARHVGDVALAEEGQQVVLAEAVEVDVAHEDHLVTGHREAGVVQDVVDVAPVPARQEAQRSRDALGRSDQALARRVFADLRQQELDRLADARVSRRIGHQYA